MTNQDFYGEDGNRTNDDFSASQTSQTSQVIIHATFSEWPKVFELTRSRGDAVAFEVADLGYGLLHLAADRGEEDALNKLLALGLNPNLCTTNQESPLHWAAGSDSDQSNVIVGLLIEAGADVNKLNDKGSSPLMIAVIRGKNSCIPPLIEGGAIFSEEYAQSMPMADETKLIIRSALARRAASEALQKIQASSLGL